MKVLKQKVAALTGAGSGIGRALALELAKEGCVLAISDINNEGLQETACMLKRLNAKYTTACVDVSNRAAVYQWAEDVIQDHGRVNLIINNAGVSVGSTVENIEYEDFEWLMNINFWGVVYGTKAFLPYLKNSQQGHIVNISSMFGLIGIPNLSAYNAAKFAVRGFTESLREELLIDGSSVKASCVLPGAIQTNITRSARMCDAEMENAGKNLDSLARTTPEEAAVSIVQGIKKDKARILVGYDSHILDNLQRSMPSFTQDIISYASKRLL